MVISFYASVRSPPATRKFSSGNAAGQLQANSNLSPPARNRSRSRSPAAQRKTNGCNISPEPSQVSLSRSLKLIIFKKIIHIRRQARRHFWRHRRAWRVAQCRRVLDAWSTCERSRLHWRFQLLQQPHTYRQSKFHLRKKKPSSARSRSRMVQMERQATTALTNMRTSVITEVR